MSSRQVTQAPVARASRTSNAAPITRAQMPSRTAASVMQNAYANNGTMPRLNYDSARVAPPQYMQAAAQNVYSQNMPAPQYSPASAADFSACQLPQPIQIKVPQVTVRRHTYPVVFNTFDRVVSHELIEVPVQYQQVQNPVVEQSICNMGQQASPAYNMSGGGGYGTCSKSSFTPGPVVDAVAGSWDAGAAASPYQYASYSTMM